MKKQKLFYRVLSVLVAVVMLLSLSGCGRKVLHCDNCGKEVKVSSSSNMEEDWMIYCGDCQKELGLENVVPEE